MGYLAIYWTFPIIINAIDLGLLIILKYQLKTETKFEKFKDVA
jgi:hypothetical protein